VSTRRAFLEPHSVHLIGDPAHKIVRAERRTRGENMSYLLIAIAVAAAATAATWSAHAENNTIGVGVTSDRDPDKFAVPKNLKYELNGT
jgi:hypothetical protein